MVPDKKLTTKESPLVKIMSVECQLPKGVMVDEVYIFEKKTRKAWAAEFRKETYRHGWFNAQVWSSKSLTGYLYKVIAGIPSNCKNKTVNLYVHIEVFDMIK